MFALFLSYFSNEIETGLMFSLFINNLLISTCNVVYVHLDYIIVWY